MSNSDMSENYQDLSVSRESNSDLEFMRRVKMYRRETRHESRDIGYDIESQSDELEIARYQGITFSGIKSNRTKKNSKSGDFYATVTVDTESSQSAGKTDPESNQSGNQAEQTTTGDESDISLQQVLLQEESEKEDIKYLIDQADILVQKGNSFSAQSKLSPNGLVSSSDSKDESSGADPKSLSSSASSGQAVQMADKGVGTLSSSGDCNASAEESEDSDEPGEEISMATTDPDTFDSVVGEEYTSDEMKNGSRDYSKLPKLFDTNTLRTRLKGPSRERPWSVIELPKVAEIKPLSASESAIDKLTGTHSDSDLPSKSSWSQNCSPTFQRHRIRRAQCIQRSSSVSTETNNVRSQVGAKRKLNLEPLNLTVNSSQTETGCVSGNTTIVPSVDIYTTDDEKTPLYRGNSGLMHTLQSARFKSSGSTFDDSDTQDNAEPDDPNNDALSFSENAWDNYQPNKKKVNGEFPVQHPYRNINERIDERGTGNTQSHGKKSKSDVPTKKQEDLQDPQKAVKSKSDVPTKKQKDLQNPKKAVKSKSDNPKIKAMLDTARSMPFAQGFTQNKAHNSEEEESEIELSLEEKVISNIRDNRRFLEECGLIKSKKSLPNQKQSGGKTISSTETIGRKSSTPNNLPNQNQSGSKTISSTETIRRNSTDSDDSDSGCECLNCPWKEKLKVIRNESNGKAGKAGVYSQEDAKTCNMVEILPGTGVYITMGARSLIFNMASSRIDLALRLFKNFYSPDQMLAAGYVGNLPDSAEIIPAIIACSMKIKKDWEATTERKVMKAFHNTVQYRKRDKEAMKINRKRKILKKEMELETDSID